MTKWSRFCQLIKWWWKGAPEPNTKSLSNACEALAEYERIYRLRIGGKIPGHSVQASEVAWAEGHVPQPGIPGEVRTLARTINHILEHLADQSSVDV